MDIGTLRGLFTLALFVLFVAVVAVTYSRRRKPDFDAAAQLPLADDDDRPPAANTNGESTT